jgi:ABC-type transport system substrate-binding protein
MVLIASNSTATWTIRQRARKPLRTIILAALALVGCSALGAAPDARSVAAAPAEKVLRYAFPVAETGFDPAQLSDLYSRIITANVFDALYTYDFLARPTKLKPNLAEAMPEVSPDFKTYTIRLRPGVFFADDPVFGGRKRELTAHDVVYSYKRIFDPKCKSPSLSGLQEENILGLAELRAAVKADAPFDYDREIEGLRALDRYTVQFKLGEVRPRFIYSLADPGIYGIVAREVVEAYGDRIMEHPVGTGAFRLKEWRRSSKITLTRNPNYREVLYDAEAPANDPRAQTIARALHGRRLPMIDTVEVSIVEEDQPRWLAFLGHEHDLIERLPNSFVNQAIPQNRLAPNLAKQGIQMTRVAASDVTFMYFAMEHPLVGGYSAPKVALRRAIALAYNAEEEVRLPRRGQAIVAQGPVMPMTIGYDPSFRSEMGQFDHARAVALLDLFGYVDRDGDGWRDQPDGKPLVLEFSTIPAGSQKELDEIFKKNMDAIRIRVEFKVAKWPELLKASRAGKLMIWALGLSASTPDGASVLSLGYSQSKGQSNHARFDNARYDALYRRIQSLPDGVERAALVREAIKLLVAYMPYKFRTHRILTDLAHAEVKGYVRHPFARDFWRYVDLEPEGAGRPTP